MGIEFFRFESSPEATNYPIVTYREDDTWYAYPMGIECKASGSTPYKAIANLKLAYPIWYAKKKKEGEKVTTVSKAHHFNLELYNGLLDGVSLAGEESDD